MPNIASTLARQTGSAVFRYVDPDRIDPDDFRFSFDHAWSGIPVNEHKLPIMDASDLADAPRLEREGFQTVRLDHRGIDYRDPEQIETLWKPAICRLVKQVTGADAVADWAFGARFSERDESAKRSDVSNPARRVHGDFSPTEFGREIRHGMAAEAVRKAAQGRTLARWIGINVWQTISPPPYDTPLAVCDTRTVRPGDLVIGKGSAPSMPEISIELPLFAFSERHRWYYYSAMEPDEVLLFSGIDSAAPDSWRLVPHTAFDNPTCPQDAPPRNSIEMRTMALFFK